MTAWGEKKYHTVTLVELQLLPSLPVIPPRVPTTKLWCYLYTQYYAFVSMKVMTAYILVG